MRRVAVLALIAACGISMRPEPISLPILGERPAYAPATISAAPNSAAIDRMIWVPGLDAGWDPQGLAFAEGKLFVSAYQSRGAWQFRGPCRVYRVDPETGRNTGHVDVPPPCGHAGGIAYAEGELFVADTRTLFEFDLDQAFGARTPSFRVFPLGHALKGAFAAGGNGAIWIGDYEENRPAKIYKFNLATIDALPDGATLTTNLAATVVPIPTYGQGAAIGAGKLWISRSSIGWGYLDRLDAVSGRPEERYAVPAGIEGIAVDEQQRLWAVSEAGARHLPLRYPFFPLIFRLDPTRLVAAAQP
jgi:hypothetical protein